MKLTSTFNLPGGTPFIVAPDFKVAMAGAPTTTYNWVRTEIGRDDRVIGRLISGKVVLIDGMARAVPGWTYLAVTEKDRVAFARLDHPVLFVGDRVDSFGSYLTDVTPSYTVDNIEEAEKLLVTACLNSATARVEASKAFEAQRRLEREAETRAVQMAMDEAGTAGVRLYNLLRYADWYSDFSDDPGVRSRADKAGDEMRSITKQLMASGHKEFVVRTWKQFLPKNFKRPEILEGAW